jgi:hypothetical protein
MIEFTTTLVLIRYSIDQPQYNPNRGAAKIAIIGSVGGDRATQNDPNIVPSTMTATKARMTPTIPTMTMSK